jgi:hypothetical protein
VYTTTGGSFSKVGTIMSKLALALCMVVMAANPSLASFWTGTPGPVSVPEIDGPAGASALALLVAVGLIAYQRWRH